MESTTQDYLRKAAIEALSAKADTAAMELLGLLHRQSAQKSQLPEMPALPAANEIIDGPAHSYHYWARFIRENFIPFMLGNGRLRFTSYELFSWLKNCTALALTTGDIEQDGNGKEVWKNIAYNGLASLKKQGVVYAPASAKAYQICSQCLPEASEYELLSSSAETP